MAGVQGWRGQRSQSMAESGRKWFGMFQGQVCDGRCFCLTTELTVMLMHLKYDSWSLRGRRRFHGRIHRVNLASAARAQLSWPAKLPSLENFWNVGKPNKACVPTPLFRLISLKQELRSVIIGFFVFQMAAKHCKMHSMQFKGCAARQVGSRFYIPLLLRVFLWVRWSVQMLVFLFLTSLLHFARLRLVSYLANHLNFISDDKIQLSLSGLVL